MGTTSFRTADFNQKIERQLTLLSKFWEVHTDVWGVIRSGFLRVGENEAKSVCL